MTEPDALERIRDVWGELWSRTWPRPPMLDFAWARNWWRLHGREGRLNLLLVLDPERRPLGLAPLYRRTDSDGPRRYLRTLSLLGTGEAEADEVVGEYNTWLAAPEAMPLVSARVAALLGDRRTASWDLLRLERLRPEAGIHEQLAREAEGAISQSVITTVPAFRTAVRPLAAFVPALSSGSFRHRCRRALRAGAEAEVEVVRARDPVEMAVMLEALRGLHQRRWNDRGQAGVFSSAIFTDFHEHMVQEYARQDRVWMVGLRRGRRWLAVRYLLRAGDTLYDYASGVDTETETALAPGLLLHLHTIDLAAAAGLRVYDLGAGDLEYKRKLCPEESALPTLELFARTMRARLWLAARDLRRDLAQVHDTVTTGVTIPVPRPEPQPEAQPRREPQPEAEPAPLESAHQPAA